MGKQVQEERCPKCNGFLLEIIKDEYPEYVNHGNVEGFKHRYVCTSCGHETIYNTLTEKWEQVPEDTPFHYGKKGNRLLFKVRKQYLDWVKENWREIQEEYIEYCQWAGHIDKEEFKKMDTWITTLNQEEILLNLRQISEELSNPDYLGCANIMLAIEILMLTDRLEKITS